ncbi:hypothetical protein TeGR_g5729 [Tetraparma gracilis]|uniref:Uncharacterized protein n=1 Tax=Tetraparma gracilis TaxID=2962635 RepID=A0ABQ6NC65_9STRA|nr:hypothetical protein TeGR_g5729 [Tetraparma gracilis]
MESVSGSSEGVNSAHTSRPGSEIEMRPSSVFRSSLQTPRESIREEDEEDFRARPMSMMLPRTTRLSTAAPRVDLNPRNSDSAVSMSTRSKHSKSQATSSRGYSKSRADSIHPRPLNFSEAADNLTPYRSFYTSLTLEARKLQLLDSVLAAEFRDNRIAIQEHDDEGYPEGLGLEEDSRKSPSSSPSLRPSKPRVTPPRAFQSLFGRPSSANSRPSSAAKSSPRGAGSSDASTTTSPLPGLPISDSDGSVIPPGSIAERISQQPGSADVPEEDRAHRGSKAFFFDLKKRLRTSSDRVSRAAVYVRDAIHERPIKTHRCFGLPMQT